MLPKRRHSTILLLLACCCSCLLAPSECRTRDKVVKWSAERVSASTLATGTSGAKSIVEQPENAGICTRHRDMKVMCYCTSGDIGTPVIRAECWVLSDGLLENDTAWTGFNDRSHMRDLKFVVQNHGYLDYIPTSIFEQLKNLTSITLEYAQMQVVKSYAFANLSQLELIVLNYNQIITLEQDSFANHGHLRELNLAHNQISEINPLALRDLPRCERFFLNNNNVSSLHEGLFVGMVQLAYLNLANNLISVLTSEIFKGLWNLSVLKLTHNNINFIGDTVLAELWSLAELELDDNRIERISERALDGLNNLKTLNLRNNLLTKIDNGLLRSTPALLSINVQNNNLETLTFFTFQPIMDNLVNSSSELLLLDNNFICDCRLLWIFDLRDRTRYQPLRDSLDEIVCLLQEPKLSNFLEPIPNDILDLLNIGGSTSNRKNFVAAGATIKQNIMLKPRQMQTHNLHGKYSAQQANVKTYYSEDGIVAQLSAMEETLGVTKQNALLSPHHGTITTNQLKGQSEEESMGFKVRLHMLKTENLPCPNQLVEPTELPLSRDLVDSRSNLLSNSSSNLAVAGWCPPHVGLIGFMTCISSMSLGLYVY